MISRTLSATMALAMLLSSAAVPAQQDSGEPASTEAGDSAETAAPAVPERSAAADRSPSDYRPSEQISEDLSVSFPVDI
jgi:hypothetical protein